MPRDARRRRLVRQSAGEVCRDAKEGAGFRVAEPSDDVRGAPEEVLVAISEILLRWRCAVVDADRLGKVLPVGVALRPKKGESKLSTLTLDGVTFAGSACAPPIEARLATVKTEID
jgi:hypothetical protein